MYWFRSDAGLGPLALIVLAVLWTAGGSMLAAAAFRLERRERLLAGLALGVTLSVWLSNLVGRWLPPTATFWVASAAILIAGLLAVSLNRPDGWPKIDAKAWGSLALVFALVVVIMLISRGLGILDDRKNLSFISVMAAGDIPPHFYMNPQIVPTYHYGFQLLGAELLRLAGMFPWSAFDLAKSLSAAMAIGLSVLVGWRLTHRTAGAMAAGILVSFASGGRWLMLFVPQGLLRAISAKVVLWGSAATSAPNLYDALGSGWVVAGGPPVSVPFAFVNGVLEPFILGSQAGPGALSLTILMLVLLLLTRARGRLAGAILVPVLASWALVSEADFVLYAIGLALIAAISSFWRRSPDWRRTLRIGVAAVFVAGLLSLFQGGTLTELRRGLVGGGGQGQGGESGDLAGFSLRWPPAIVSSHLGELSVLDPALLFTGLLELGPALLAAPVALLMTRRLSKRGRFELAGLGAASGAGLLLPLVLRFQTERDITRLSAFGLLGVALLALPAVALRIRRSSHGWLRWSTLGWLGVTCFGGLVVLGALMTAIPRATISPDIAPIDARMADRFWGRLDPESMVLDSSPWRAVALTGRPTRSSPTSLTTYPEWEQLVANPRLDSVITAGYQYVYVDEYWWQQMGGQDQAFLGAACVRLLGSEADDQANGSRRLFDLKDCMAR